MLNNVFKVVFILEHVISDNVGFQNFPISAETWLGNMTFRLAIIVSDNPINLALSMGIL